MSSITEIRCAGMPARMAAPGQSMHSNGEQAAAKKPTILQSVEVF